MKVRNESFEISDQRRESLGFSAQRKQLLFEIQIEGQRRREIEGELRGIGGSKILSRTCQGKQLGMQLYGAGGVFLRRSAGLIVDDENFGLQERAFLIDGQEFKTLAAFGDEIESAVRIFFYDGDDFGGASYLGEPLFHGAHNAELSVLSHAFADHLLVTRFENVQRQGSARE